MSVIGTLDSIHRVITSRNADKRMLRTLRARKIDVDFV